ncbi:DUF1513 domain-containing protein [Ideonella sp.]|uniref:DUF1513 domain-containing protein n=1 Tax=Ideonella sp. TaxID=1929293 RepID=UPI0035B3EB3D
MDTARRRWMVALAGAAAWPAHAWAQSAPAGLALAWDEPDGPARAARRCIGVWRPSGDALEVASRLVVPTRAHGVARLAVPGAGEQLVAVARRPGLWMRRWSADGRVLHEAWAEPGRQFNGHVWHDAAQGVLFSTEQRHEDGAGVLVLRDPLTLARRAEWPTGGTDPHALLAVDDMLFVANGGVPTRPESGRTRDDTLALDSSLVAFDRRSGQLRGRWRLPDPQLSLRHLAWHPGSRTLGIALQAEHADRAARATAPLLAVLDRTGLRAVPLPPAAEGGGDWAGYAGDIVATPGGFRLGATRADALLGWSAASGWAPALPLVQAGAQVASDGPADGGASWSLGAAGALCVSPAAARALALPPGCLPDNHAVWLPHAA